MTGPQEIPVPPGSDPGANYRLVNQVLLSRTLRFLFEKAMQNHKLHESWNEGANGEFITCTRGDCMEAKVILGDWEWSL